MPAMSMKTAKPSVASEDEKVIDPPWVEKVTVSDAVSCAAADGAKPVIQTRPASAVTDLRNDMVAPFSLARLWSISVTPSANNPSSIDHAQLKIHAESRSCNSAPLNAEYHV